MQEAELIKNYYRKIVSEEFPYSGILKNPGIKIKAVDSRGCHGNNINLLFLYIKIKDNRIESISYECEYCDVTMYVTGELVCRLINKLAILKIQNLNETDFKNELGGKSRKIFRQVSTALRIFNEELLQKKKNNV
ncbi:hypothetical protein KAW08_04785 [bacterium]|nr:hypothetical protein [bacterium]